MTNLGDLVPEHTPDKDSLVGYGLAVVGTFPVFGSVIADISTGMLAQKREARQHEFNTAVAVAVEDLTGKLQGLTPEALLDSEEFLAAYEKVARVAAETRSTDKRMRLARVLARMGPWSDLEETKRAQFLDLVARLEDIDIFVLQFFRDPAGWLMENAPTWNPESIMMSGLSHILGEHVFSKQPNWRDTIMPVVATLKSEGLADIPMGTTMSVNGLTEPRTTPRGRELLHFIGEDNN